VSLVRSGEYVFAITRTPDTPVIEDPDFYKKLDDLVNMKFNLELQARAQREPEGLTLRDFQEAALIVNVRYCKMFHLAFYAGRANGPLQRVYP